MGLSVAFDLATHRGYDSDHPRRVVGDVGKAGVAIDSVEDMKLLFDGIPLDKMSVSMTMNGAVLPVLAGYVVAGEEQGVEPGQAHGDDPERHPQRVHGPQHLHLSARTEHADRRRHHPVHREAHAEVQLDLDLRLPHARSRVRLRCKSSASRSPTEWSTRLARPRHAGSASTSCAGRLSFFFAIGMNFFMEIAKLRAARLLWARIMTDLGAKKAGSKMLRTHCQTSGVSLTEQDPYNNIVRTAYEALAAVLGGTQSLHTNSFDEAIALPTEFSARIARNTQLILAEETGVTHVIDPLGGSYYVEALTQSIANEAWKLIQEVEQLGGMTKAVESGMPKLRIEEAAARRQARVDRADEVIVGVNKYKLADEAPIDTRDIDNAEVRRSQLERLARVKAQRDPAAGERRARSAHRKARRERRHNLLATLDRGFACSWRTVGEISDAMEKVFGRHRAVIRSISGVYGLAPTPTTKSSRAFARKSTSSRRKRAGGRASSWPSSARTATTAAPR